MAQSISNRKQNAARPSQSIDLDRSLAIFYHPLFQEIAACWGNLLQFQQQQQQKATDVRREQGFSVTFIQFIELNLRIQKALLPQFEIQNAFVSALNDWLKEVLECCSHEELYTRQDQSLQVLCQQIRDSVRVAQPVQLTLPPEQYVLLIQHYSQHEAFKLSGFRLTAEVLCKFLFDLTSTWCEFLDIQLFAFFLYGLLLHITDAAPENFQQSQQTQSSLGSSSQLYCNYRLKATQEIACLPLSFFTTFEQLKSEYSDKRKKSLRYYRAWCEQNYLRLSEVGESIVTQLQDFYESEGLQQQEARIGDLISLFERAIDTVNEEISIHMTKSVQTSNMHERIRIELEEEKSQAASRKDEYLLVSADALEQCTKNGSSSLLVVQRKVRLPVLGQKVQPLPFNDKNTKKIGNFSEHSAQELIYSYLPKILQRQYPQQLSKKYKYGQKIEENVAASEEQLKNPYQTPVKQSALQESARISDQQTTVLKQKKKDSRSKRTFSMPQNFLSDDSTAHLLERQSQTLTNKLPQRQSSPAAIALDDTVVLPIGLRLRAPESLGNNFTPPQSTADVLYSIRSTRDIQNLGRINRPTRSKGLLKLRNNSLPEAQYSTALSQSLPPDSLLAQPSLPSKRSFARVPLEIVQHQQYLNYKNYTDKHQRTTLYAQYFAEGKDEKILTDCDALYRIVSIFKRKQREESRVSYLRYLKLEFALSGRLDDTKKSNPAEQMEGELTLIDKQRFCSRIKRLLRRDRNRKRRRARRQHFLQKMRKAIVGNSGVQTFGTCERQRLFAQVFLNATETPE